MQHAPVDMSLYIKSGFIRARFKLHDIVRFLTGYIFILGHRLPTSRRGCILAITANGAWIVREGANLAPTGYCGLTIYGYKHKDVYFIPDHEILEILS